jgi:hypothetical protein
MTAASIPAAMKLSKPMTIKIGAGSTLEREAMLVRNKRNCLDENGRLPAVKLIQRH